MRISHPVFFLILIVSIFSTAMQAAYGQDFNADEEELTLTQSLLNYVDYNRVEGVFLGTQLGVSHGKIPGTSLNGRAGYGFKSKDWNYAVTLSHSFDFLQTQTLSATVFDETRSNDSWILSHVENILSTTFLRKDYRDYFRVRGVEGNYTNKLNEYYRISANVGYRKYNSMHNTEPWSLFFQDEKYWDNPPVTEQDELLIAASIHYSTLGEIFIESNYWQFETTLERELNDFTFTGVYFSVRRMQLSFSDQTLITGLRGGFRNGTLAEQYLFDIGGFGTMRAYEFKEFTGTRKIVFEGNYLFNGDLLQRIPLQFLPFYSNLTTGVYFDAGLAWFSDNEKKILETDKPEYIQHETGSSFGDIRSGVGVSLYIMDSVFAINAGRRLDTGTEPWNITFRFRLFQNL